jgi:predicted nuclease of restriction endonuclease-like RecB superfamily
MAFRRQDIPKTTRKPEEGGPRRIYPRFLRDRAILPKVDLAIDYLDSMVGRRRGELSADMLLELFGDPKLSRCLLSCMNEHYVYRTPEIADVTGAETAAALMKWGICTSADLRGHLYLAANASQDGFVAGDDREPFFAEAGEVLGLSAAQIEELIHLDAERNAQLIRIGLRPRAEDVVARYNALLVLSVLRHASTIALDLSGLSMETVSTVCARHDVSWFIADSGHIRLAGRRSAVGTWSGFGSRLARCALQLLLFCPRTPTGEAKVHFGDQTYRFVIDAKCAGVIRPKLRVAADPHGISAAAALADELVVHRRESEDLAGWRVRRWPEPVVVDDALILPELAFTYGQVTVAALPVPAGREFANAIAALQQVNRARPVVALGLRGRIQSVPSVSGFDAEELGVLLAEISQAADSTPGVLERVEDELAVAGWLSNQRLEELLLGRADLESSVAPLISQGMVFVQGFGLCRSDLLEELSTSLTIGLVDIAAVRTIVAARVGDAPGADALTLYLLSNARVVTTVVEPDTNREAA